MAGAILTSVLKKLSSWTPKASSSSSTELPSSEQELQKLGKTMKRIHALLEDAEEKDMSDKSEQLRLRELKEIAYDAEDAVDEYEYEVLHAKVEARRRATATQTGKKVIFDLNSYHPKVSLSDELGGRVKQIRERFEEITDDWNRIGLCLLEKGGKRRRIKKWKPTETTSCFDKDKTFGREDENNEIIKWLLQEESNSHSVSVLGIVGMGGLGKTTLAQMAYSDVRVCKHFELRGWVYVSEDFDVANLVKKICSSFGMNMNYANEHSGINLMNLDEHYSKLKRILHGKKSFLVLDDVWNQRFELWSSLKTFLVGAGVEKILVTTRNEYVAKIMQTTPHISLSHLSFDHAWSLFEKIAYGGRDHNFVEIGKKIVDKCKGLPLAVKVLAGILRVEDEEEAWIDLLESDLWKIDKEKDDIFPVLNLSYERLPLELKQCFMYLCLFPKGSILDKSIIVQQWVSLEFIQPKGKKMEEDIGNNYINEFLHRSILQNYGETFIMHDLIHDLAQSVAKDEYLLMTTLKSHYTIPKTIRHVSIYLKDESEIIHLKSLHETKHLRTFKLSVHCEIPNMHLLDNLRCLRTLVLDTWNVEGSSDSIGNMKHLRYLDLGRHKSIPVSVYNLHHLHTLKYSSSEIKLSRNIEDLISLRHLNIDNCNHLPREIVGLTNLQTLPFIYLGGDNEFCKLRDLKGLPNLKGSVDVSGLEAVAWPDITPPETYLKDTRGIKELTYRWVGSANVDERLTTQVLDSLQPHHKLEKMNIHNYPGIVLPAWLGYDLLALKKLYIKGARRVKSFVVPMGEKSEKCHGLSSLDPPVAACTVEDAKSQRWFPSLKELCLTNMDELEGWQGSEDCYLPCLSTLTLKDCPKLRKLPSLSCLSTLWIDNCPGIKSLPSLPLLTKLTLDQCSSELLFGCSRLLMYSDDTLSFFDERNLDMLEKLFISNCPTLRKISSLSRLSTLMIEDCPELKSLPYLPLLTTLSLSEGFSSELLFGCSCLPMINSLSIAWYSDETLIFPDDGSLNSLESLSIEDCSALRSLEGLSSLASLKHLETIRCPLLRISPEEHLPPKLQDVKINIPRS